jgi:hypothetical protein
MASLLGLPVSGTPTPKPPPGSKHPEVGCCAALIPVNSKCTNRFTFLLDLVGHRTRSALHCSFRRGFRGDPGLKLGPKAAGRRAFPPKVRASGSARRNLARAEGVICPNGLTIGESHASRAVMGSPRRFRARRPHLRSRQVTSSTNARRCEGPDKSRAFVLNDWVRSSLFHTQNALAEWTR